MLTAVVSHHLTKEESGDFCSICRILARDSMRHSRKLPPLLALEPSWANQAQKNHGYLRGLAVVLAYTNRHSTAFSFAVLHTRHLCLSTSIFRSVRANRSCHSKGQLSCHDQRSQSVNSFSSRSLKEPLGMHNALPLYNKPSIARPKTGFDSHSQDSG